VAVQSFTWPSTIYAIEANIGNKPVFCDIHRDTLNLDLETISKDSYDNVIAVDVFGNEANIETDKPIIYDAAHGFGLKNLGHRGLAEVVSFSFTKVATAMEGGIILTQNEELSEIAYELRRLSARMLEINAYILLKAIKEYQANYDSKKRIANMYSKLLKLDYIGQKTSSSSNYSVFPIILRESAVRNAIIKEFDSKKIEYKIYYQPMVEGLPVTDWVFEHILCLPIYTNLTESDIIEICSVANSASKHIHVGHNYLRNSKYIDSYLRSES
jgi:dTDP-4-amino-4,6-dideoxygalactose transaminase